MKEHSRLSRLTSIVTQLQSKRIVTASALAKKYNVSVRTIYRDIRAIEQSGVPIVTEEGKGYSLMEGYRLPPIMFTEEEANALITAEQLIRKNKDQSLVDNYQNAITKIKAVLKHSQKESADLLTNRVSFRANLQAESTSHYLMTLQSAITQFNLIELEYLSLKQERSTRMVEPFALYSTQENWLLIAFCHLRKSFRVFRIDFIQKLTVTNEYFEPHDMTIQEYYEKEYKKFYPTPDIPLSKRERSFVVNLKNTTMKKQQIEKFHIVGIWVKTTNQNNQAKKDIGELWQKFMGANLSEKLPNIKNPTIYAVYTEYEGDHTQPYTTILGYSVDSLDNIPEGMKAVTIEKGVYHQFTAKGDLTTNAVVDVWNNIWDMDLNRTYTTDFEVYGEKAADPKNGEAEIYIATK